ncbi:MAG: hypothetical protein IT459_15930 [Planctomycetes bacterium]|nr:hypothetical protein [Planctomycetota bacterium]
MSGLALGLANRSAFLDLFFSDIEVHTALATRTYGRARLSFACARG